jgi:ribosomal protein S18 acetylase RimI-like enzyme
MDLEITDLEIRTARADDCGPIAELMFSSSPEMYGYLFQGQAIDFLRYQFDSGTGVSGWPNVTVAVLDSEVVGAGCFYDCEQTQKTGPQMYQNILGFFGESGSSAVLERLAAIRSYLKPPREGEIYLSNFGVTPHLRSRGIGSRMLRHQVVAARAAGYTVFGLGVSKANPRGEALYRRLGLKVTEESEFPVVSAGVPGTRKMELELY